jgi:hypothetical protein
MQLKRIIAAGILIGFFVATPCVILTNSQKQIDTTEIATVTEVEVEDITTEAPLVIEKNVTELVKAQEEEIIENENQFKEVSDYVYTLKRVNIRTSADVNSDILITAAVGTKLHRVGVNIEPDWDIIEINGEEYYISNEFISIDEPENIADSIEQQLEDSQISESDLRYLSAIIWAEAGNQCEAGQQAVGIVVMNRVESEVYKDTIYDVINEPYQFSPVNNGSFNKALNRYDNGEMPEEIITSAKYALQGNKTVYYNGGTVDLSGCLYFSRYVKNAKYIIQDHQFK